MDNFYSRCLLCTCIPDVTPHLHVFSQAGTQLQLTDKIYKYLNIQIAAELPQNVCHSCMAKLEVTHELVTSSQQAIINLLHIKQQEVKQEDCSMMELDQPDTANAALHTSEGTVEQTTAFEEMLIPKIEIEELAIKLEPEEDQMDFLPQNSQCSDVPLGPAEWQVSQLLWCDFCCFYTDDKTQLATHMQAHLCTPSLPGGSGSHATKQDSKLLRILKCAECGIKYVEPDVLTWHTENCHGTDAVVRVVKYNDTRRDYQCVLCQTLCKTMTSIIHHLFKQHGIKNFPFRCSVCGRKFRTKDNLRKHENRRCKKNVSQDGKNSDMKNSVKCSTDFKSENLRTKDSLKKHEKRKCKKNVSQVGVNSDMKISSAKCSTDFESENLRTKDNLQKHEKRKCKKNVTHDGEISDMNFSSAQDIEYVDLLETTVSDCPFCCTVCGKQFETKDSLLKHQQGECTKNFSQDGENSVTIGSEYEDLLELNESDFHPKRRQHFQCVHCNEVFIYFPRLKSHCDTEHPGHKNVIKCDHCEAQFAAYASYWDHKRNKHEGRVFMCDICNHACSTYQGFMHHKKYKHTPRVFTCTICSATLSSPSSLRAHIKALHSQLKQPFSCQFCAAEFKCKRYLESHVKGTHTGEVLHCQYCKYTSRNRHTLNKHTRRKHER